MHIQAGHTGGCALVRAHLGSYQRVGASPWVANELRRVCAAARLEELGQRTYFALSGPHNIRTALSIEIQTLRGYEKAIVESGLATADELRCLADELEAAKSWSFEYRWGAPFNELLARVPDEHAVV